MVKIHSLKRRYVYKLFTNILGYFISLFTIGIVPQALGVNNYGNFSFATTIISKFLNLLDFRASTCFFTRFSQRPNENNLIKFYEYYSILIVTILTICIFSISITPLKRFVFPEQNVEIIFYSLVFVLLSYVQDFLINMMDAKGLTVTLEKLRIGTKIFSTILLLSLYYSKQLNLTTYYYYYYIIIIALIIPLLHFIRKNGNSLSIFPILNKRKLIIYFKEFYIYSAPLGIYIIISFIQEIFDRWILQHFGGSYQQGLYSFSFSVANLSFLFITAMFPLFTRELSIAAGTKDIPGMARLFRQYAPLIYSITAYFSCFIFVYITPIIKIFGGIHYLDARMSMKILAFYPLISVYTMLNGSVIYANARTKIVLKMSLIFAPLCMISTYFLISNRFGGLNLGATGLAIKNVFFEFISVIILLWINTRFLKINFFNYLLHIIFSLVPFIVLAYLSQILAYNIVEILNYSINYIFIFLISGIFYSITVILMILLFPVIIGAKKNDLINVLNSFKLYLGTK